IVTTEARAKEIRKFVEPLITLAVKEKDNYETVKVTAKVARKDKDGKRVKQIVDKNTKAVLSETHRDKDGKILRIENGMTVTVYDEVEKEIKKDLPSRLHARSQMMKMLYPVKEVPSTPAGRKKNTKEVNLVDKLFDEYGPKYANRHGGYTRIIKIGPRKGDAAMEVVLELV
ncbi:MAG: bL17 family ribosomal protein, partial [Lachnospiraceae bacterium]|nr:bL17 family ribosomal protein [Lachnospiraceae bacterium]